MLVLSRKAAEAIQIGENVRVIVLAIQGNHVRLGIEAPGSIRVLRTELLVPALSLQGEEKVVAAPPRRKRLRGAA